MYEFLVQLHSIGRWVVLILLLVAFFKHLTAGSRPLVKGDYSLNLFLTIFADIMLLIGLYLWFAGPWGLKLIQSSGMGEAMKNPVSRFYVVEHNLGMLVAIALIHIGKAQAKKSLTDAQKHKRMAIFFGIALLLILLSVPWPFRVAGEGRGWF